MEKGQSRIIIENLTPEIDAGRFAAKRIVGEAFTIMVDIFGDGHDIVNGYFLYKHESDKKWSEIPLTEVGNDAWTATFTPAKQGYYSYTVEAWMDHALDWHHGITKKAEAGQHVNVELNDGTKILKDYKSRASKTDAKLLDQLIKLIASESTYAEAVELACSEELELLFRKYPAKNFALRYPRELKLWVDRKKALFSTWYEFFPRSASQDAGKHGTFKDCARLIPRVSAMGFDTLYFPPIHPIGELNRKGKNNAVTAQEGEPGSPWAIGSRFGGHTDLLPELGTLEDFKQLMATANDYGIEIAMDFALQCAPDHPWVKEHPQWFKWRSDGTVQYAENPPKKYQDILPIYFETEDWQNLWKTLTAAAIYWVNQGIRVFRVDNPHTKPFVFWEYLIEEVHKINADVLFLSEAFTRPKVMHELAKRGFTQSYSYYTWRNNKAELTEYLTELSTAPSKEFFRANFWPNTPDINPYSLQSGNESMYMQRLFMAATMNSNYGVYGPVYEYIDHAAMPGKEDYYNSEKYEVRLWDWNKPTRVRELMTMLNRFRKENEALQFTANIQFCDVDNDNIIAYLKISPDGRNKVLMVVSLNPYGSEHGMVKLPLNALGIHGGQTVAMHDLITNQTWYWSQEYNFVALQPNLPFHLMKIN